MIATVWTRVRQWAGMLLPARQWFVLAAAVLLALPGAPALAQSDKEPIRMLVGFPAGGTIDIVARLLAEHLKDELGATVIVDSKPGAGGQIAAQALKAAADGRTMLLSPDHTMVMSPLTLKNPGFQPLTDVPTFAEQGYKIDWEHWPGMFMPAATPAADVRERMAKIVFEPAAGSPEELARLVRAGTALWEPVVRASGWVPQ